MHKINPDWINPELTPGTEVYLCSFRHQLSQSDLWSFSANRDDQMKTTDCQRNLKSYECIWGTRSRKVQIRPCKSWDVTNLVLTARAHLQGSAEVCASMTAGQVWQQKGWPTHQHDSMRMGFQSDASGSDRVLQLLHRIPAALKASVTLPVR